VRERLRRREADLARLVLGLRARALGDLVAQARVRLLELRRPARDEVLDRVGAARAEEEEGLEERREEQPAARTNQDCQLRCGEGRGAARARSELPLAAREAVAHAVAPPDGLRSPLPRDASEAPFPARLTSRARAQARGSAPVERAVDDVLDRDLGAT
jgi:hypothetical protein